MKHIYITGVAILALTSVPLIAQKTPKVHPLPATPVMTEFEGPVSRSYLGVGISDLTDDRVQALKLKDDRGIEITQVDQDAPAGKAGFKEHDVVVAFNGTPVESQEQFKRLMRETKPGRTVSFDIMRDGQPLNIKVQLADRKKLESTVWPREPKDFAFAMPAIPAVPAMPDFPRVFSEQTITRLRSNSGITLESLTPQLGDYFGVKNGEGMLVRSVQKGSAAETAGIRAGDVIIKAGDQKIADSSDWREAVRNSTGKLSVVIVRDKKEQTLSMSVPARRSSDSSAVYRDPELAIEAAAERLEDFEPLIETIEPFVASGVLQGMSAIQALIESPEVNRAMKDGMKELRHELIKNRRTLDRNISGTMKLASAQLKDYRSEMRHAMKETQKTVKNIQSYCRSEMH